MNNRIYFFESFEQAREADAKRMAELSPVEHLRNATLLIQRLYGEELKLPVSKKIRFCEIKKKETQPQRPASGLLLILAE